jgi:hypothetical protein
VRNKPKPLASPALERYLRAVRYGELIALWLLLSGPGCADPSGRFQAFGDRRAALDNEGGAPATGAAGAAGAEQCMPPAPGVVYGPALLAIETSISPGLPILFMGEVETPELDGKTAVKYSYMALAASDRQTQVGDPLLVGPYPIEEDGSFTAPTAKSTLPGSANTITPGVEITSELTLHGTICGVSRFYCGTVTGTSYFPLMGPTTGQFGLTLLESEGELPERPRFGCDEDALGPALEP